MKSSPRQTMTAPIRRVRFVYVAMFFCFWAAAIGLRLFWLQVVRHSEFVERALKQQQRTFEVAPRRGVLYDRNLRELAMTVLVDSIYAVPSETRREPTRRCCNPLEDRPHRSARSLHH